MIGLLAYRNIAHRPLRSLLLLLGYGIGVGVMIILLSVGEALVTQAQDERLVGGGEVTVLPQGIDVEVMKTGGVGGLWFSIDHSRFIYRQLLTSPRYASVIEVAAPQIDGRLVYLRTANRSEYAVRAIGEIPSKSAGVGSAVLLTSGSWRDDDGDRRWIAPTPAELRHDMDHFHLPPDTVRDASAWAEWHYFNVLSSDRKRWAFISLIVAGDVRSGPTGKWLGNITVTLREESGATRRFTTEVPAARVRFSTQRADLTMGSSSVTVLPDGTYDVRAIAREENGAATVAVRLNVRPAERAYFAGGAITGEGLVSGYTVPALRASATGEICVGKNCERFADAQAYHDHNWGLWRGVTWDWGAARAGEFTMLYGRVIAPDSGRGVRGGAEAPLFVYLVDSLGFRAVMRPATIRYVDGRSLSVSGRTVRVPARADFVDVRGADTLRARLDIEDAIATDMRTSDAQLGMAGYFIQMKGTLTIAGRLSGQPVSGKGTGFFETFR